MKFIKDIDGIRVYEPSLGFTFGACCPLAIAYALKIPKNIVKSMLILVGGNPMEGCSSIEIDKVVKAICTVKKRSVYYKTIKTKKLSVWDFCKLNQKGKFLLGTEMHLCYIRDGKVIDDFFSEHPSWIKEMFVEDIWLLDNSKLGEKRKRKVKSEKVTLQASWSTFNHINGIAYYYNSYGSTTASTR